MGTRKGSRIRLSDNPMELEGPFEEDPVAEDPMMEDPFEEEPLKEEPVEAPFEEDELEAGHGVYRAQVKRGRRVNGPKTKLSASAVLNRMESAVIELADNQATMARSVVALAKSVINRGKNEEAIGVTKSSTRKARTRKGDTESSFQPYGGEKDEGDPESQDSEESTMNEPGLQDPKGTSEVGKRAVQKDDASGNFGEKDSDIPGNREAGVDDKDKPAEEYLIQGAAGDGPGPVSKAVGSEIDGAVNAVLAKHGIIKKAVAPAVGNSTLETGGEPDMDKLFDQARGMSFADLNRVRVESGELPRTLI